MPARKPKRSTSTLSFVKPQLATLVDAAPSGQAWITEHKYDGYRMQAHCDNGSSTLYSRNTLDWSHKFPEIRDALGSAFGQQQVILDGEIIVGTPARASFQALQTALGTSDTSRTRYVLFDLISYDGLDLRPLPWHERRTALEALYSSVAAHGPLRISTVQRGSPATLLRRACSNGGEGIICKRREAPYQSGRGRDWLKIKCSKRQEFVVVGFTPGQGTRSGFGALLLGVYSLQRELQYVGRVGTGFSDATLKALHKRLNSLTRKTSPLHDTAIDSLKNAGPVTWVRPELVAEVSFTEWTADGSLRHPVFHGLREDKPATSIVREGS